MKDLSVGDNRRKKACRWFVSVAEQWWFNQILRPIFFLLPPAVFSWAASENSKLDQLKVILSDELVNFISASSLMVLVAAYIYVAVAKGIYAGIKSYSKPARSLCTSDLAMILATINTIVADKENCILEEHAELYRWILNHFVLRLTLEHNLIILKEKCT